MSKKTVLSGIQSTSVPTLGNYLGAIQHWLKHQEDKDCLYAIVDLHSLTVPKPKEVLADETRKVASYFLACGLDPLKSILFLQSRIPEHLELAWILTCQTYMGELQRMTQFKDKSSKHENIPVGLFVYPSLMAADILLYQTQLVPVGEDQKQHIELTRNLAQRFNTKYQTDLFTIPEPLIEKEGARIMDLQSPLQKMSKSAPSMKGVLFLSDSNDTILKKVKTAITDSHSEITSSSDSPGIKNLLEILGTLTQLPRDHVHQTYLGQTYGRLKIDTADQIIALVEPIRTKAELYLLEPDFLNRIFDDGCVRARVRAAQTVNAVYDAVGLLRRF